MDRLQYQDLLCSQVHDLSDLQNQHTRELISAGRRHTGDLRPLHEHCGPRSVSDLWPATVLSFSITCSGVLPTQKSSPLCWRPRVIKVLFVKHAIGRQCIYIYLYKTACFTGCQECFYFLPSKSVRLPTFKSSLHFYPCTRSGQVFPCGPSGTNNSLCLSPQTTLCLHISCVSRMKYVPVCFSTRICTFYSGRGVTFIRAFNTKLWIFCT